MRSLRRDSGLERAIIFSCVSCNNPWNFSEILGDFGASIWSCSILLEKSMRSSVSWVLRVQHSIDWTKGSTFLIDSLNTLLGQIWKDPRNYFLFSNIRGIVVWLKVRTNLQLLPIQGNFSASIKSMAKESIRSNTLRECNIFFLFIHCPWFIEVWATTKAILSFSLVRSLSASAGSVNFNLLPFMGILDEVFLPFGCWFRKSFPNLLSLPWLLSAFWPCY